MTDQFSQADLLEVARVHYSSSLHAFVKAAWPILEPGRDFIDGWHIRAVCDHLEAVSEGRITRLAISIPPGFMKSLLVSVFWPAWEWTTRPHLRFLTTSAALDFCERDAGKMRILVGSEWYQALWPMTFIVDSVTRYQNNSMGERFSKSFTSLTGGRASRLIIDDPIPVKRADSETIRAEVNDTFFSSATSRGDVEAESAIVIIMQRVHEEDLIGEIKTRQDRGEDIGFEFLTIPMTYEGDENRTSIGYRDPRKNIGDLILPEYRSNKFVAREKATMGEYRWSAQYQQDPIPRGTGFFKREHFKLYAPSALPAKLHYYMTSDHANGGKDYNVFRIWGIDSDKNFYMIDSFRDRCSIKEALGIVTKNGKLDIAQTGAFALIKKWRPLAWFADADPLIRANWQLIDDTMRSTLIMTRLEIITQGTANKIERASALQTMASLGKVFLPNNSIGECALEEYEAFGLTCRHDDQVDADGLLPRMAVHAAFVAPPPTPIARPAYGLSGSGYGDSFDTANCF